MRATSRTAQDHNGTAGVHNLHCLRWLSSSAAHNGNQPALPHPTLSKQRSHSSRPSFASRALCVLVTTWAAHNLDPGTKADSNKPLSPLAGLACRSPRLLRRRLLVCRRLFCRRCRLVCCCLLPCRKHLAHRIRILQGGKMKQCISMRVKDGPGGQCAQPTSHSCTSVALQPQPIAPPCRHSRHPPPRGSCIERGQWGR